jgi:hypothetical protein
MSDPADPFRQHDAEGCTVYPNPLRRKPGELAANRRPCP